ncbi:hypothetical protein CHS0354_015480 [Potamilus streckersoni]|uniref:Uncharacterized protein n=1 Tax=Potamilus streckersoni TaxID=2493646 RepID=A0AAE0VUH8_9BIVA|nr:hypothetical protein CHS0354_015480 [Potamilus streckersoni]
MFISVFFTLFLCLICQSTALEDGEFAVLGVVLDDGEFAVLKVVLEDGEFAVLGVVLEDDEFAVLGVVLEDGEFAVLGVVSCSDKPVSDWFTFQECFCTNFAPDKGYTPGIDTTLPQVKKPSIVILLP